MKESSISMRNCIVPAALCLAYSLCANAQEFAFPAAAFQDNAVLARAMPGLAARVLDAYQDAGRETYLDNLFRLQMVAGEYDKAAGSIRTLRQMRAQKIPGGGEWVNVQYEVYAKAKAKAAAEGRSLDQTYAEAFREQVGRLDDSTSFLVIRSMGATWAGGGLKGNLDRLKGKTSLTLAEALQLVHDYQASESYREFGPVAKSLIDEDNARRYIITPATPLRLPDGATVCTIVTRPRSAEKLPSLLTFTIYASDPINWMARMAASRGYVGVVGLTRGKQCSPDQVEPYHHDGKDAAQLIDWIAAQPWSDGRVGMYGGSYSGFTAWATAKYMPKALKAIAVGAAASPGIDVPMEGNVFWNFIYPWPFYTTDNKLLDDATYGQTERWEKLNRDWYVNGRAYRDLDKIDGKANPIFDEWISHPSYDSYWQQMIPNEKEFTRIKIPVLQTAGYYYGGPGAAVYYFTQHTKYNPDAESYLLIGPYHHFGAQTGVVSLIGDIFPSLSGMKLDPAALINIEELRFAFFDWKLKNAPRPELLKDKVNYEVTGGNVWKHAPTLEAMSEHKLRLHLSSTASGKAYRLSKEEPTAESFVALKVDLADRSDADRKAVGGGVEGNEIDMWNGLEFVSDPLPNSTELSGLFSGRLDFVTNKRDFDFEIDLYELAPNGHYVQLAPFWTRASYNGHPSERRLLQPGKHMRLDFQSVRLMSRQLQAGSRVVLILTVIKAADRQINYGTDKDVSDETIRDAGPPLEIKWFGASYVELPSVSKR